MKVWVTKYALTEGVFVIEANQSDFAPTMIYTDRGYFHKPHWHETRDEAQARAAVMADKKMKSLWKQINKLETFPIEIPK